MCEKSVCRTPTAAFESLGLRYAHSTLPSPLSMGSLRGGQGFSCQVTWWTAQNGADPLAVVNDCSLNYLLCAVCAYLHLHSF